MKKIVLVLFCLCIVAACSACGPDSFDSLYEGMMCESQKMLSGEDILFRIFIAFVTLYVGELLWRKYNYG